MRALPRCSSWYGTGELEGVAGFPRSVEGAANLDMSGPRQIWNQYADHGLARARYTLGCRSTVDTATVCWRLKTLQGWTVVVWLASLEHHNAQPIPTEGLSWALGLRMPCPVLLCEHWRTQSHTQCPVEGRPRIRRAPRYVYPCTYCHGGRIVMVDVLSWLRRPPRIWLSDVYLRSPTCRVRRGRADIVSNGHSRLAGQGTSESYWPCGCCKSNRPR
jgi:hypothetical protein